MVESSKSDSKSFSVRIVSMDYYMAPPIPGLDISYSSFQGGKVNEVPVIRIYGSTPAGQKACLHVHRALPYLYVPYSDISLQPDEEDNASTNAISLAIDKALKLKGNAGSKRQHVHGCSLVRAKKFYGFHSSEELFVKIYLYYPQDVSRAATLLLGGAVLDRILQPHESHIPYLLQFLIDYNLYGMGHVHVSKIKFRHPVPEVFSPRKATHTFQQGDLTDQSPVTVANTKVDSDVDPCLASPIWTSSTIPDDWTWQSYCQPDSSVAQNLLLVKRQSISELEGDAVVEDILNQLFISYTSLSQTRTEEKMVPSLIPIWEEFERSGEPGPAVPPDPGKPLPEDVLRKLSHGLELEKVLTELSRGENLSFSQDKSLTGPVSSGNLSSQTDDGENYGKEHDWHVKQLSVDQLQVSTSGGPSNPQASDQDAFRLLKWLASSQAAEEINSDDELAHQTILSPLLPASTINKLLEKASTGFESQSQKECQDILDSVEDAVTIEKSDRASNSNDNLLSPTLHDKIIPQVDGSPDDLNSIPFVGKLSSEVENGPEASQVDVLRLTDCKRKRPQWGFLPVSSSQNMNNGKSVHDTSDMTRRHGDDLRISLETPFHEEIEVDKYPNSVKGDEDGFNKCTEEASVLIGCSSMRDLMRKKRCYRGELPECRASQVREAISEVEQKEEKFLFTVPTNDEEGHRSQVSYLSKPAVIDRLEDYCERPALRECVKVKSDGSDCFMHGKSHLNSTCGSVLLDYVSNVGQICASVQLDAEADHTEFSGVHKKEISGSSQLPGEHRKDWLLKDATGPSCQSSRSVGFQTLEKNHSMLDSSFNTRNSVQETHETPNENLKDMGVSTGMDLVHSELQIDKHHGEDVVPAGFCSATLTACSKTAGPLELIELTLSQKPPVIDWTDEIGRENLSSLCSGQDPPEVEETEEGISLMGGVPGDILPFFKEDNLEEKGVRNLICQEAEYSNHQEAIIGVPVHYQNDGSYLYMLAPIQSPPSEENVMRWLSLHARNTLRERTAKASVFSASGKNLSTNLVNSHGCLCPDSNLSFLNSGSRCELNLDQLSQHNKENRNQEVKAHNGGVRTIQKDVAKSLTYKPSAICSQEFSQLSGPDLKSKLTPLSQMGFRDPASVGGRQQLTILSVEVQAGCRGDLRPDPRFDAIDVITLVFQEDDDAVVDSFILMRSNTDTMETHLDGVSDCKVLLFPEEKQLFSHFMKIISYFDPDILMGWDIQGGSLGFLAERALYLGIGLLNNISRIPSKYKSSRGLNATEKAMPDDAFVKVATTDSVPLEGAIIEEEWGRTHASGIHVGGRIVLNIWRLVRGEVKLNMYTVEAVAEAVLRKKVPSIPCKVLANWFSSGPGHARYRCMEYVLGKAKLNLHIMNQLDMVNRTSELARVFGIDFFSVLSRGSQYRVESMFLRLAHTQNYVAISPGNLQVAYQPAMECLPLVMEPESGFYADPVVVLDFQSLYPSMIIAYNLCFSTCLGKITPSAANILGVSSYSPDRKVLQNLKHELLVTPNGVMYVPSKLRKGVLPRLLEEILSTRIMVKQAIKKLASSQQVLHRIFNARQLALKLIANVTYGYTAAGFSGRMPCAELADSIVQCGRRTLESAISFVNNHDKWKAKVIYGDTDSMFVLLKGRSRTEAFRIGSEIASRISAMNPNPVALKMEKVYHPCFLLTKKRYVGYSYESPDQSKPKFDAKGIETVRRDTCEAVSKTLEQSLKLYFEHQDIDKVKAYLIRQWTRIISGRVSLQDFVFAKEVRLGTYSSRASSLPPSAIVATKAMRADPRAEPRYAERVPYVVVHGEPGARLVDMVVDPMELLAFDSPYRLNVLYYITKQIIPALQRVFGLVGADLKQWFFDMPRPEREVVGKRHLSAPNQHRTRIDFYYLSQHCILCGSLVQASSYLCHSCSKSEVTVATALTGRTAKLEKDIQHLAAICRHCGGGDWLLERGVKCTSLACSIFYERRKVQKELKSLSAAATEMGFYPTCMAEWF